MTAKHFIQADAVRPIRDNVLVTDLDHGPHRTRGGLIIPDDNMTERGIHDRWCRVWAVGPEVRDVAVGEWVLVKHGRWTPGIELRVAGEDLTVWRVEWPEAVLLAADSDPRDALPTAIA